MVNLGVELPVDMKYVSEQDLTDRGIAVVTARKLLASNSGCEPVQSDVDPDSTDAMDVDYDEFDALDMHGMRMDEYQRDVYDVADIGTHEQDQALALQLQLQAPVAASPPAPDLKSRYTQSQTMYGRRPLGIQSQHMHSHS